MILAVVRSPLTEPSFLISLGSFARRIPFTDPYTTTSRAIISAVNLAVAPTVSLRSSSCTRPSTVPSIVRSSLPEISPLICRLGPSRAVARSAVAPNGRIASVLIAVVSSRIVAADFGGGFIGKLLISGWPASSVSGFLLPHIGPPRDSLPHASFRHGIRKKIVRGSARNKHNNECTCLKVTRPKNRVRHCTKVAGESLAKPAFVSSGAAAFGVVLAQLC